ncbi:hypothetical protein Ddc_13374 [Ditylenchus destructor]|nr:hypothetical protein Ddc_13374 [Ditylenchus destructor]
MMKLVWQRIRVRHKGPSSDTRPSQRVSRDGVQSQRPASGKQSRPTFRLTREQKSGMYKRADLGAVAMDGSSFFLFYAAGKFLEK